MKSRGLLLYHGLPLLVLVFPFLWFYLVGSKRMLEGEGGIVENATVLFLLIAIGFCIAGLSKARRSGLGSMVKGWLLVLILGAAYFALEEISYGQHQQPALDHAAEAAAPGLGQTRDAKTDCNQ